MMPFVKVCLNDSLSISNTNISVSNESTSFTINDNNNLIQDSKIDHEIIGIIIPKHRDRQTDFLIVHDNISQIQTRQGKEEGGHDFATHRITVQNLKAQFYEHNVTIESVKNNIARRKVSMEQSKERHKILDKKMKELLQTVTRTRFEGKEPRGLFNNNVVADLE